MDENTDGTRGNGELAGISESIGKPLGFDRCNRLNSNDRVPAIPLFGKEVFPQASRIIEP